MIFPFLIGLAVMMPGPDSSVTAWRDYRTYSAKDRIASDFLTNRGPVFGANPKRFPFELVGGAGGGGKSHYLRSMSFELNMVLRDHGFPNQWGVLACDTYPNLRDRFINRYKTEFQGIGEFANTQDLGYHVRFYGEGMGGVCLRNLDAGGGRRGSEFAWGLGDELTDWTRQQYEQFIYTLRSPHALPFYARGFATNPDGIGHRWVKEIFVPEYRNLTDEFFEVVKPENFFYVPMVAEDNALFDVIGDQLLANIAAIQDPNVRRARRFGDWDIYGAGRFTMFRESVHRFDWDELISFLGAPQRITPEDLLRTCGELGCELYGSLDYGTSQDSISAYLLHLVAPDGSVWTVREHKMVGIEAERQAKHILDIDKGLNIRSRIADPSIQGKKQFDQSGLTIIDRFRKAGVVFQPGINDRIQGAATVAALLDFEQDASGKVTSLPMWRIHRSCKELLAMIPNLARDPLSPEDVFADGGANHWYDSARYFLHTRFRGGVRRKVQAVVNSAAYFRDLALKGAKRS